MKFRKLLRCKNTFSPTHTEVIEFTNRLKISYSMPLDKTMCLTSDSLGIRYTYSLTATLIYISYGVISLLPAFTPLTLYREK